MDDCGDLGDITWVTRVTKVTRVPFNYTCISLINLSVYYCISIGDTMYRNGRTKYTCCCWVFLVTRGNRSGAQGWEIVYFFVPGGGE